MEYKPALVSDTPFKTETSIKISYHKSDKRHPSVRLLISYTGMGQASMSFSHFTTLSFLLRGKLHICGLVSVQMVVIWGYLQKDKMLIFSYVEN